MRNTKCFRFVSCLFVIVLANAALGSNWPSFRGPNGNGIGEGDLPTKWDPKSGENIKWKARIPGLAHSSPIVWGDKIFVTTAVSKENASPEVKIGWLNGTGDPAADSGEWTWKLLCIDRDSGKIVWEKDACSGVPKIRRHMKASHANCTPATDGKHVVAFFGSEGLYCFDFKGELLWKKDLGTFEAGPRDAGDMQWGVANSPIVHDGKVVLQVDALNNSFWATFDADTGNELKRVKRDEITTWATPTIIESNGKKQIVCNGWKHMGGYDLETGEELWKLNGGGDCPVPTPQFAHGLVYLTNSHGRSPIYAIDPKARGDITPKEDTVELPSGMAWYASNGGSYMPTPIVVGDLLYVPNDNGIVAVFDAKSGKQKYKERLPEAGTFSASVVAAKDKLYFINEDGEVFVIKTGDKFELLGRNSMGEVCMATPAIADGKLFIRGRDHLYCIAGK